MRKELLSFTLFAAIFLAFVPPIFSRDAEPYVVQKGDSPLSIVHKTMKMPDVEGLRQLIEANPPLWRRMGLVEVKELIEGTAQLTIYPGEKLHLPMSGISGKDDNKPAATDKKLADISLSQSKKGFWLDISFSIGFGAVVFFLAFLYLLFYFWRDRKYDKTEVRNAREELRTAEKERDRWMGECVAAQFREGNLQLRIDAQKQTMADAAKTNAEQATVISNLERFVARQEETIKGLERKLEAARKVQQGGLAAVLSPSVEKLSPPPEEKQEAVDGALEEGAPLTGKKPADQEEWLRRINALPAEEGYKGMMRLVRGFLAATTETAIPKNALKKTGVCRRVAKALFGARPEHGYGFYEFMRAFVTAVSDERAEAIELTVRANAICSPEDARVALGHARRAIRDIFLSPYAYAFLSGSFPGHESTHTLLLEFEDEDENASVLYPGSSELSPVAERLVGALMKDPRVDSGLFQTLSEFFRCVDELHQQIAKEVKKEALEADTTCAEI